MSNRQSLSDLKALFQSKSEMIYFKCSNCGAQAQKSVKSEKEYRTSVCTTCADTNGGRNRRK